MVLVKLVLIFGSKIWVLTPCLEKSLEGFHPEAVRRMVGMGPKRQWDWTWVYTPIGAELAIDGLEEIGVFISCRQNMVSQYIF